MATNSTSTTPENTDYPDYAPLGIEIGLIILGIIIWAILRYCVFRNALKEKHGGPTEIHIQTNAEIDKQQNAFSKNGGQPNQARISREQHEKNMAKIRRVIGDEEAANLEKELDARGFELDADAVDRAVKKGGPDVAKIMMRERCGFNEAVKIAIKEQSAAAMKNDPEFAQRVKDDPELAQQAIDSGAFTKSEMDKLIAENGGGAAAGAPADGAAEGGDAAPAADVASTNNN